MRKLIHPHISLAAILLILVFFAIFTAAVVSYTSKVRQITTQEIQRKASYEQILDGVNIAPSRLTVNYSDISWAGSPLIFGGAHNPPLEQQEAWNKIREAGVNFLRMDINVERELPANITLDEYKSNKNNIQDTLHWNTGDVDKINNIYINARKRDMKVMAIMSYAPRWLTFTNSIFGVPKDWDVYKDIVKKSYKLHRNTIDYLEIWNEPSFGIFLDTKNSGLSKEDAYKKIFKAAVEGVRQVDTEMNDGKRIKIGGPVSHTPKETSMLEVILKDPELRKELDFISYHNYEAQHLPEPSDIYFKEILNKYTAGNLPLFITEWNYDPQWDHPNPYNTSDLAISYVGNKFISFLKMGLTGANYFSLEPLNTKLPNNGEGYYGFYRWKDNRAELLPQARSWRLMSKQMSLGSGESKIFSVSQGNDNLNTVGFINSLGQQGIVIANASESAQMKEIHFENTGIKRFAKVRAFYASPNDDASVPAYDGTVKAVDGTVDFTYYIPENSVTGILISEESEWYDKLHIPIDQIVK